jgi:hypothetical protein
MSVPPGYIKAAVTRFFALAPVSGELFPCAIQTSATSDVIRRAVAAYQESEKLLAQIEMAERGHALQLRGAQPINDGSD